ncbi:DUF805 domain-containing protein [Desulforhopalus vacuolatus]|uniref:DUF805 domain-containing protein n=1 Tax=Desulforhopalus vacuolatus TaxID=40414 RepID=UPI001966696C|nr:DUF805 domain-containing protein [Desulforhopalus vacuolatus]MBM9520740.1 DUF805 domain-containing protein [Desulforhopalus vacuolatus]
MTQEKKNHLTQITCSGCKSVFSIDLNQLPRNKVKVKCKKCANIIILEKPSVKPVVSQSATNSISKICPKCNAVNNNATEMCESCGIIFSKYKKFQSEAPKEEKIQKTREDAKENKNQNQDKKRALPLSFSKIKEEFLSFNVCLKIIFCIQQIFILVAFTSFALHRSIFNLIFSTIIALPVFVIIPFYFTAFVNRRVHNEYSIFYKYLFPEGVMQQLDYFLGTLIIQSILIALSFYYVLMLKFISNSPDGALAFVWALFGILSSACMGVLIILFLMLISSFIIISLKRISDIGKSRWLALLFFIPGVNLIFQISLYFIPSSHDA